MVKSPQEIDVSASPLARPGAAGRQKGIDALRFLLCFPVALIHTLPGSDYGAPPLWVVITASACRGAVPFFFIASGFFTRVPERLGWKLFLRPVSRILPVYVVWMIIYYMIEYVQSGRITHTGLRDLFTGGDAGHLWFLPALATAMIAVPVLLIKTGRTVTWLVCLAIAALNLAFDGYHQVLHTPEIAGRHAMIAPLLFLMGMELAQRPLVLKLWVATAAVFTAWVMTVAEEALIANLSGTQLYGHGNVATTYLFGLAIFLFARSLPNNIIIVTLAKLGYVSLGIYASHGVFLRICKKYIGSETLSAALYTTNATIALSTILCLVLARIGLVRRFVQ